MYKVLFNDNFVYFSDKTGSVFEPPEKQLEYFIKRNNIDMKIYYKNEFSKINSGWKLIKIIKRIE